MNKTRKIIFLIIVIFSIFCFHTFAENSVFPITKDWAFYWNQFISSNPEEEPSLYVNIPESWNDAIYQITNKETSYGYASYRKVISGLIPNKEYAILINESPESSCKLFVNGELLAQVGTPAISQEFEIPHFSPIYIYFSADSKGEVELIFHISNYTQSSGGILSNVFFGDRQDIFKYYILQSGLGWLVVGTLIILTCFNFMLFALSPSRRETLYFALLTFVLALRVGISGFSVFSLAFPNISQRILLVLESVSVWITPMLLCFIILASTDMKTKNHISVKILLFSATIVGFISLLLPESFSTFFGPFIEGIALILPCFIFIFLIMQIKVEGISDILNLATIAVLTFALGFQMFDKESSYTTPFHVYPLFFLIFAVFQFINLAAQESIMHHTQKRLVKHLKRANDRCLSFVPKEFLNQIEKKSITKVKLGDYTEKKMTICYTNLDFISKWETELSSEQEYSIFSECVSIIVPIVKKYNGYIAKIISKDLIILFPNHPSDAIKYNLEASKELTKYENLSKNDYFTLKNSSGLHYGEVLLGTIGEENRLDDTVISESVNIVARLATVAKKYNVDFVFSDEMFYLIRENYFDFSQLGITTIKGKSNPLSIYTCTEKRSNTGENKDE